MKLIIFVMLFITLSGASASATIRSELRVRESMIVSSSWLGDHLADKSLVLLHVGEKEEYFAGHIPAAQFIALADISTPRSEGLALELPPAAQLRTTFRKARLVGQIKNSHLLWRGLGESYCARFLNARLSGSWQSDFDS